MKGFFITATNTNLGKTVITLAMVAYYQSLNLDTVVYKPIQTGARDENDCDLSFIYQNLSQTSKNHSNYRLAKDSQLAFSLPCSPHLASKLDKKPSISLQDVIKRILNSPHGDLVLIEGAGGVQVPLNLDDKTTMLDLIGVLGLPTLIVGNGLLGGINDTVLTIQVLQSKGVHVAGFMFNNAGSNDQKEDCSCGATGVLSSRCFDSGLKIESLPIKSSLLCDSCLNKVILYDNAFTVKHLTGLDFLGYFPYITDFDASSIAQVFKNNIKTDLLKKFLL